MTETENIKTTAIFVDVSENEKEIECNNTLFKSMKEFYEKTSGLGLEYFVKFKIEENNKFNSIYEDDCEMMLINRPIKTLNYLIFNLLSDNCKSFNFDNNFVLPAPFFSTKESKLGKSKIRRIHCFDTIIEKENNEDNSFISEKFIYSNSAYIIEYNMYEKNINEIASLNNSIEKYNKKERRGDIEILYH